MRPLASRRSCTKATRLIAPRSKLPTAAHSRYPATMATKRKPRKSSGRPRGAALAAKRAPKHCRVELSSCMKGGGRKVAGKCMRAFHTCKGGEYAADLRRYARKGK